MGIIALMPWSATAACCASTVARSSACRIRLPSPRASMTALFVIPSGGAGRRRSRGIAVVPKEGLGPLPGGSRFLAALGMTACLTPRFLLAPEPRHQPNQAGAGDDEQHRPRDA